MTTARLSAISPLSSHDHRDASIGGVLVWMDWFSGVCRTDTEATQCSGAIESRSQGQNISSMQNNYFNSQERN